jgi:hypothetical protein
MIKSDQAPVISVTCQMIDAANEMPNPFGGRLGDHELLWSLGHEAATARVLLHDSQLGTLTTAVGLLTVS